MSNKNQGVANMANETIYRLKEVKTKTGLSRSTIYDLMKQGHFPQSINLGLRAVGWLNSEIEAWIQERVASRSKKAK